MCTVYSFYYTVRDRYGVPGSYAKGFETCLARILGETLDTVSEHLYRITKMLSPVYLQKDKVQYMLCTNGCHCAVVCVLTNGRNLRCARTPLICAQVVLSLICSDNIVCRE